MNIDNLIKKPKYNIGDTVWTEDKTYGGLCHWTVIGLNISKNGLVRYFLSASAHPSFTYCEESVWPTQAEAAENFSDYRGKIDKQMFGRDKTEPVTPSVKEFISECKANAVRHKNQKTRELFNAFKKIFPILRLEGSWSGQENNFYLGWAAVAFETDINGSHYLTFRSGPASSERFYSTQELVRLLSKYSGLEEHILGEDKSNKVNEVA